MEKDNPAQKNQFENITLKSLRTNPNQADLFNAVCNSSAVIYWWIQPTHSTCHYSPSFCERIGLKQDAFGKDMNAWQQFIHPMDRDSFQDVHTHVLKGEVSDREVHARFRNSRDEWIWYKVRFHPATLEDANRPSDVLAVFEDISAEKQLEHYLQEQNAQLFFALENAEQALWDLNFKTGTTFYSPSWSTMLGYKPGEITDATDAWQALVHPEDLPKVLEADRDHIAGKTESFRAEFRMRHKEGHWVWILDRAKVVERDDQGKPVRMIGTHTDITQRVNTVNLLEESQRRAKQAAQAKTEFLSNMSHELRTPLTSILGISDLLLEELGPALSQEHLSALTMQREAGIGLLAIVNDILDFNKIETGELAIENIDFSLPEQLVTVFEIIETTASKDNISVQLRVSQECPKFVLGDPLRLRQILINLLSNAIKFTPSSGEVSLFVKTGDVDHIVFQVTDTGIGIAPEKIPDLFQRFTQADTSTTRQYGGSGLGLAITKQLVELMGGTISVESKLNEGTSFTVTIPFEAGSEIAVPLHTPDEPRTQDVDLSGVKILLAEDNEVNQTLIKSRLAKAGADVVAVSDGTEAVAVAGKRTFDVILMDIQMPNLDGVEASRLIREHDLQPSCPILALTANVYAEREAAGTTSAIDAWLTKPVDWPKLFAAILEHTGKGEVIEQVSPAQPSFMVAEKREDQSPALSPQLKEMLDLLGPEETQRLAEVFREELETRSETIGLNASDPDTISKEAHALASAAYSFGFIELSDCCRHIMALCETSSPDLEATLEQYERLASGAYEQLAKISEPKLPD